MAPPGVFSEKSQEGIFHLNLDKCCAGTNSLHYTQFWEGISLGALSETQALWDMQVLEVSWRVPGQQELQMRRKGKRLLRLILTPWSHKHRKSPGAWKRGGDDESLWCLSQCQHPQGSAGPCFWLCVVKLACLYPQRFSNLLSRVQNALIAVTSNYSSWIPELLLLPKVTNP